MRGTTLPTSTRIFTNTRHASRCFYVSVLIYLFIFFVFFNLCNKKSSLFFFPSAIHEPPTQNTNQRRSRRWLQRRNASRPSRLCECLQWEVSHEHPCVFITNEDITTMTDGSEKETQRLLMKIRQYSFMLHCLRLKIDSLTPPALSGWPFNRQLNVNLIISPHWI